VRGACQRRAAPVAAVASRARASFVRAARSADDYSAAKMRCVAKMFAQPSARGAQEVPCARRRCARMRRCMRARYARCAWQRGADACGACACLVTTDNFRKSARDAPPQCHYAAAAPRCTREDAMLRKDVYAPVKHAAPQYHACPRSFA